MRGLPRPPDHAVTTARGCLRRVQTHSIWANYQAGLANPRLGGALCSTEQPPRKHFEVLGGRSAPTGTQPQPSLAGLGPVSWGLESSPLRRVHVGWVYGVRNVQTLVCTYAHMGFVPTGRAVCSPNPISSPPI